MIDAYLSYQLITIEDEQVALAGSIPGASQNSMSFFPIAAIVAVITALVIALIYYILKVNYYKKQLLKLAKEAGMTDSVDLNWNIKNIRTQILVIQNTIANESVSQFATLG